MIARGRASSGTLAGKCYCGAVEYAVADEFQYAANCHCSNCRRTTSSAFKPFAGIVRPKLAIAKGASELMILGLRITVMGWTAPRTASACQDGRCHQPI